MLNKEDLLISGFKQIKKETVSETIIEQIKEMISQGNIKPGQRLPSERELSEALNVSRPSVREAMRALKAIGVVEIKSGEGTFLKENINIIGDQFILQNILQKYDILHLTEARKILETEIVGLAVERITQDGKDQLRDVYNQTLTCKNNKDIFIKTDFAFHVSIAEASENKFLIEMLNTTRDLLIKANIDILKKPGQIEIALNYHREIFDAIIMGDKDRARQAMKNHLENVETAINEIYK